MATKPKTALIYCPPRLRVKIEEIGRQNGITGITPTLNHIIHNYEGKEVRKKRGRPFSNKWL